MNNKLPVIELKISGDSPRFPVNFANSRKYLSNSELLAIDKEKQQTNLDNLEKILSRSRRNYNYTVICLFVGPVVLAALSVWLLHLI